MKRLMLLVVLCSCATLDTSMMSDRCRTLYDRCLSNCSRDGLGERTAPPPMGGPATLPTKGPTSQIDVAGCTANCNAQAKACK